MKWNKIRGNVLIVKVAEALGIEGITPTRIVIDIPVDEFINITVEGFLNDNTKGLDIVKALKESGLTVEAGEKE